MDNKNIKSLVCGLLFNPSFKLLDYWGSIADDILYDNECFPENFFPNISSQYTTERGMFNYETRNEIRLTSSNLIYTQFINDNYDLEYKKFCQRIQYLADKIIVSYALVVRRIGLVYSCELDEQEIKKVTSTYFKNDNLNISDFRFSIKEPTKLGSLWSDKNDYINKIYTVGDIGKNIKGLSYDYQHYYIPAQPNVKDKLEPFFKQCESEFQKDIKLCLEG